MFKREDIPHYIAVAIITLLIVAPLSYAQHKDWWMPEEIEDYQRLADD